MTGPRKLSDIDLVFDVTNERFGAVGDGRVNDRVAIQCALDAADGTNATVVLPAGNSFLSGNLKIGNDTTLRIDGSLVQSSDPNDYNYRPAVGHDVPGGFYGNYLAGLAQPPFLLASRVRNVTVTGTGSIVLMGGPDQTVINVAPIGFYRVDGYEISGVTLTDSHSWNIMLFTTTNGLVKGVTIRSANRNSDGICIFNSQDVRVTENDLDVADDGIYVRTGWNNYIHDRELAWWSSRWPQPSQRIEVDNNTVISQTRGFAFIPWGAKCPDQNSVEISDVSVHHNSFTAREPLSCWCDDPAGKTYRDAHEWQRNMTEYDNHVPIKDVTFTSNTYVTNRPVTQPHTNIHNLSKITNLTNDYGALSWPGTHYDVTTLRNQPLPNGDFETGGLAYWSHSGEVSVHGASTLDAIEDSALRDVADQLCHAPDAWGWFALLRAGTSADSRVYQGLGLKGIDTLGHGARYRLDVRVAVADGGGPVELFARDPLENRDLGVEVIKDGYRGDAQLEFDVPFTRSVIEVGIRIAAETAESWALLTAAQLTFSDPATT